MIQKKYIAGMFTVLLGSTLCTTGQAAEKSAKTPEEIRAIRQMESSKHMMAKLELKTEADKEVAQANAAFGDRRFTEAIEHYSSAKTTLEKLGEGFIDQVAACQEQINKSYFEMANDALEQADKSALVKDYDEAIGKCREAAKMYPDCAEVMERKIAHYTKLRDYAVAGNETSTGALISDIHSREYEIQVWMRRGREYAAQGLFGKARNAFQEVIVLDPYRADAAQSLQAVNLRIKEAGERRNNVELRRVVATAEREWLRPIRPTTIESSQGSSGIIEIAGSENSSIAKKLKSIVIDSIEPETEISLETLLGMLRQRLIDKDPENIGINIFMNFTPGSTERADFMNKRLSVSFVDVTALEAIQTLCDQTGLRYRVEKYAVVLEPPNMLMSNLVTKIIPFDQSEFDGDTTDEGLQTYFEKHEINFPAGAKITYDSRLGRIIATNTPENIASIEDVINEAMSSREPLVQINLRFIEVEQSDLNLLGFNYQVTDGATVPAFGNATGGIATGFSFDVDTDRGMLGTTAATKSIFGNFNLGTFTFAPSIDMVNNISTKDILASPRLVTRSGQTARVKLVEKRYFPEDWDAEKNDTDTGDNVVTTTYRGPVPSFESDPTDLGVDLSVEPQVDTIHRTITMALNPLIREFVGWQQYEGTADDATGTEIVKMAIFSERSIENMVTVTDGQTLVMGGITKDKVTSKEQKVPFLGDLPLIGRFFRYNAKEASKSYLLIFITPRLIKPDGTPFYPETGEVNNGLPNLLN